MNKVRAYVDRVVHSTEAKKTGAHTKQDPIDLDSALRVVFEFARRDGSQGTIEVSGVEEGRLKISTSEGRLIIEPRVANLVRVVNVW